MTVATVLLVVLVTSILLVIFAAFTGRDRSVLFGGSTSIQVDGLRRSFRVVKGAKSSEGKPRRLVIALHGYSGNGRQFAYYTALHNAFGADTVIAYPDASKQTAPGDKTGWNAQFCCGSGWKNKVDDAQFISALIKTLRTKYRIDADRVFLAGFSNGAFMTQRFAAEHPKLVAGVAVMSGTIGTTTNSLRPTSPVPMLLTHGVKDVRVRYEGGAAPSDPDFDWQRFTSTVDTWKKANGCLEVPGAVVTTPGRITTTYESCQAPLTTIEYRTNGHVWDGWRLLNVWTRRPRASQDIAQFFDRLG